MRLSESLRFESERASLANLEFAILSKCSGSSALMVCDSLACLGFSSFIGDTGKVAPFVSLIDDFFERGCLDRQT